MTGIYFIDVETVPQFQYLPPEGPFTEFFKKRFRHEYELGQSDWNELYDRYAGMTSEFCKIVSVSIGILKAGNFYVKTITGRHEVTILAQLAGIFAEAKTLGGHNILEFDGPILLRRYLANGLSIPPILDTMGVQPWKVPFVDTMAMFSASQWKYKISLDHLAFLLGVESPKGDMDGSKVAEVYYSMFDGVGSDELPFEKEQETLKRIGDYNAKDVICTARVYAKMKGHQTITDSMIVYR